MELGNIKTKLEVAVQIIELSLDVFHIEFLVRALFLICDSSPHNFGVVIRYAIILDVCHI